MTENEVIHRILSRMNEFKRTVKNPSLTFLRFGNINSEKPIEVGIRMNEGWQELKHNLEQIHTDIEFVPDPHPVEGIVLK